VGGALLNYDAGVTLVAALSVRAAMQDDQARE
jgi:hypothetical protein